MRDFVGKRYWFFLISVIAIVPGLIFLIIAPGLKPGIDFTGCSTLTLQFEDEVAQRDLRSALAELTLPGLDFADSTVQRLGENTFFVSTKELNENDKDSLVDALEARLSPSGVTVLSFDLVSPVVAGETVRNGLIAVGLATVGIFLFLWWAFRAVPNPFRYGIAAIVALIHDAVIVVGVFAILGVVADVEVNTFFLIAVLTVIGYSVNDTIVVFDRLRENIILYPNRRFEQTVNISIAETLGRSLNTSLTLLFTLMALFLFGGPTIRSFLLVLVIGVIAGTYSSIGIASQFLVAWELGDFGKILARVGLRRRTTAVASR